MDSRAFCFSLAATAAVFALIHDGATAASKQGVTPTGNHDYADALDKSILFFEGQRSGKLPGTQRMAWRGDSALHDGDLIGVDLIGGYYDAGDNVKFGFPMAFSTTVLAWGIVEFGGFMGSSLNGAREAVRWAADYILKATAQPGKVHVQIGDPYSDHNCWERPEDMDTLRTVYTVDAQKPGSEVSAEMAAALAAASIVFSASDPVYANQLVQRSMAVFDFADRYRGSYNTSVGQGVCPFYCDYNGYQDELVWAAVWIHGATGRTYYWDYVMRNIGNIGLPYMAGEFGWDSKHAGISVLIFRELVKLGYAGSLAAMADEFVCAVLPESPTRNVKYSPGGLLFKEGAANMQHATALAFLLAVHARQVMARRRVVHCGNLEAAPTRLIEVAKSQVDYILGTNPSNMSYMVGYGNKFPQRIHHRGSSLPSIRRRPGAIGCKGGTPYYQSGDPNPNLLVGAVTGGPDVSDVYKDSRQDPGQSEPTTYINAPLVGLLAFFAGNH